MVLRRSKINISVCLVLCLVLLAMTSLVLLPYLTDSFLPVEHDTFFHLSRIQHLAESIRHGQFFPAVYPSENANFGYASPLFYSDVFLILPAVLLNLGFPLSFCYKCIVFLITFCSAITMYLLAETITQDKMIGMLASSFYLFSNYRITDLYVRGALGELFALVFLPVVLLGFYLIVYRQKYEQWQVLLFGLSGLVLSHNLTFLMGVVLLVLLFLLHLHRIRKACLSALWKSCFLAFLLTAFFTLPMLEQLKSQTFIVHYYAANSNLADGAMKLWQYFVNRTVFGFSGNALDPSRTMTVNIGWTLTIFPCLIALFPKLRRQFPTAWEWTLLGYLALLLPSALLPWNHLPFQILQFPWRLNTIALLLLCLPCAVVIRYLFKRKVLLIGFELLLCCECLYHVMPVASRTFGLSCDSTWQDVLDGAFTDPYYSAYYVRVELGGGDYLPYPSCDFRSQPHAVISQNQDVLISQYQQNYDSLTFQMSAPSQMVSLPLTWYKGYVVFDLTIKQKLIPAANALGLVTFSAQQNHIYQCVYQNTSLRTISFGISGCTFFLLIFHLLKQKKSRSQCQ